MIRVIPDVENSYMGMLKIFESESNLDAKSIKNFLEDYTWDSYNKKLFGQALETNIQ